MKRLLILLLAAAPLFGGYAYKATVNFSGATTSTQTNITLLFTFSDAKLKTVGNSGQIQNLCSRNSFSIPCDFVFTNDSTCASLTGSYTWGFDGDYSATAGTGHGWLMVPSYTTSGVTPTLCIGNVAVSTYQGGATGAEFDASTKGAWHLPNGTTLTAGDFSSNGNTGTLQAVPTAVAGMIDGAGGFVAASSQYISDSFTNQPAGNAAVTMSAWVKFTNSAVGLEMISFFGTDSASLKSGYYLYRNGLGKLVAEFGAGNGGVTGTTTLAAGTWYFVQGIYSTTTNQVFVNGSSEASVSFSTANFTGNAHTIAAYIQAGIGPALFATAAIDDVRIDGTNRPVSWIATEYANQNSPPAIGAFTALSSFVANPSVISIQ